MEILMDAKGWEHSDFRLTTELKAAEQAQALCNNEIDAMVYFMGHPNDAVKQATTSCETTLVGVDDKTIKR